MAILQLIDQLADMLNQGYQVPLSRHRMVDAQEFGKMLERMRITVPSSIKESERTLAERDNILAAAHQEAERLLQSARQQAAELARQETIVTMARQEADRIIADAGRVARRRTGEADQYATQVLQDLSQRLQRATHQVENGLQVMQQASAQTAPTSPQANETQSPQPAPVRTANTNSLHNPQSARQARHAPTQPSSLVQSPAEQSPAGQELSKQSGSTQKSTTAPTEPSTDEGAP